MFKLQSLTTAITAHKLKVYLLSEKRPKDRTLYKGKITYQSKGVTKPYDR
jgi:hypothetical protein